MRKLSMKGKRRKSDNDASDGESEENGGLGSNAETTTVDAIECDTMPKTKRRSRAKNNSKNNDDRSETPQNDDNNANDGKINEEENGNSHSDKGGGKKRRKKDEPKATTSQDQVEDEDQEYEVEKIVAHRTIKGRRQFLVRWKGYNEDSDTWEQEKDLSCPKLIEEFLSQVETKNEAETSSKVSKTPKGKRAKSKQNNNDKNKDETNGNEEDDNTEYEVERIIDVYIKKTGKREFLIRWKGFKSSDDTWEPEDNLNCPELIKKFMCKVEDAKSKAPRTLRTNPMQTKRYTLLTKDSGRRLSRRNMDKQRATYHQCDE